MATESSRARRAERMRRHLLTGAAVLSLPLFFAASAAAVTITSFTPTSGLPNKDNGTACPGATVTISGSGFVSDGPTSSVQVLFNGKPAAPGSVQVGSDSVVYAVVPDGATDGPITVVTAKGSATSTTNFYVNPCPQVSLKSATSGTSVIGIPSTPSIYGLKPLSGKPGVKVTIKGTSFLAVTGVAFGGVKAKFTIDSPTQITATVPKGAKTGRIGLTYSIAGSYSEGGITPNPANKGPGAPLAIQLSPRIFKVLA
jgi:hypothetical protein